MQIAAWEMLPTIMERWTTYLTDDLDKSTDAQLDFAQYEGATTARDYAHHLMLWNVTYLASLGQYLREHNRLPMPEGAELITIADQYLPRAEQDFTATHLPASTIGKTELVTGLQRTVPWFNMTISALTEDDLAQQVSLPVNRTPRVDRLVYTYMMHTGGHIQQIQLLLNAAKQIQPSTM